MGEKMGQPRGAHFTAEKGGTVCAEGKSHLQAGSKRNTNREKKE